MSLVKRLAQGGVSLVAGVGILALSNGCMTPTQTLATGTIMRGNAHFNPNLTPRQATSLELAGELLQFGAILQGQQQNSVNQNQIPPGYIIIGSGSSKQHIGLSPEERIRYGPGFFQVFDSQGNLLFRLSTHVSFKDGTPHPEPQNIFSSRDLVYFLYEGLDRSPSSRDIVTISDSNERIYFTSLAKAPTPHMREISKFFSSGLAPGRYTLKVLRDETDKYSVDFAVTE